MLSKLIKNIHNIVDFFLRKQIHFSRTYNEKNEPKSCLFEDISQDMAALAIEKEKLYFAKYNLQNFKLNSTKRLYKENLVIIELFETCLEEYLEVKPLKILDIGSKNWFYASGEYNFFKYFNSDKTIYLDGIELDGYRMYSNFYSRADYANFYIKNLDNTRYIVNDLLQHNGYYDCILWFFPFVTEYPLLEWGLPLSTFQPEKMILKAYNLLVNKGILLIVNQDENEYNIQQELLKNLNIPFIAKGMFKNSFLNYEHQRFVTIIKKD